MKKILFVLFLIANLSTAIAQKKYTISGYIRDSVSTESLIAATVYNAKTMAGTATNQYGFYSLTLAEGEIDLNFSYVGYSGKQFSFTLEKDTIILVDLAESGLLKEVLIEGNKAEKIQETTQMSAINIPISQIKALPAFLGEVDLMKALQLTPGVQSGGEGSSGLYVRGGGPDQNLILLDGVPVYNASHLFGFFSVFNADAINNMELLKGGFPARYGGRTSSVVDINMKEGNSQKFGGEGSIGLVSSKLTLEGPIVKDKTSFIVSGRRTYIDLLAKPLMKMLEEDIDVGYYFYDLNAKINHKFSNKDRIYLSAYMGDDKFYVNQKDEWNDLKSESKSNIKWGNITSAFRWNHIYNNKLFGNTTITYSQFNFNTGVDDKEEYMNGNGDIVKDYSKIKYNSGIKDWTAKVDFDYLPSPDHYIRFGASSIFHKFSPGAMGLKSSEEADTILGASNIHARQYSLYLEDDIRLTRSLKINIGAHVSGFSVRDKFYAAFEPRLSGRYLINKELSAKLSYSRMTQYIHLLTNSGLSLPTDLWVPSTDQIVPQKSDQLAFGLAKDFQGEYEISLEGYYKKMYNLVEYKEGSSFFDLGNAWENKVVQGDGKSYGLEFFVQKKLGKLSGWLGYTLSWTDRQFDELNKGQKFYYKYDRRHDLSLALLYKKSEKFEMSATWVYGTGNSITIPIATYQTGNPFSPDGQGSNSVNEYSDRNAYRMNAYHRLDVSASFIRPRKNGERRWVIGLYNAYSRSNPFYVDIDSENYFRDAKGSYKSKNKFVQYSLFPVIPSISYQFKF
ncbi:TonB-dependent receptor [Bacteroidales bacterium]|nr:TonB-dependent receptor [Bacteroidales bacterium]